MVSESSQTLPTASTNLDHRLIEIFEIEPRLIPIIEKALNQPANPNYDRIRVYHHIRLAIQPFVGLQAEQLALRNSADYQLVIESLLNLLPPDEWDLRLPPPLPYRHRKDSIPHLDLQRIQVSLSTQANQEKKQP
jgi:hypothetical protein